MHIKTLTAATALAATMAFTVPGHAADNVDDWNTDTQAGLSSDEFRAGLEGAGTFDKWDTNGDNMLSQAEFNEGLGYNDDAFNARFGDDYYTSWDANKDSNVDENEFYDGAYSAYDGDASNSIDESESGVIGDDLGDDGFWDS